MRFSMANNGESGSHDPLGATTPAKERRKSAKELLRLAAQVRGERDALLRLAGALQLCPQNATKWIRLARLVEVARASRPGPSQSDVSVEQLGRLLTSPPIFTQDVVWDEDPFNAPFVVPIVFGGREYLTVTGSDASAASACQFAIDALGEASDDFDELWSVVLPDVERLLWASDTVARRSKLQRWHVPEFARSEPLHIPAGQELRDLQAAVVIEGSNIPPHLGGLAEFKHLCWETRRRRGRRDGSELVDARMATAPLSLSTSGSSLIVAGPNQITTAVLRLIAAKAAAVGLRQPFLKALQLVILREADLLCRHMGWVALEPPAGMVTKPGLVDSLYFIDIDKVAHVVAFVDDLNKFEPRRPARTPHLPASALEVTERMREVRSLLGNGDSGIQVLHVPVLSQLGRPLAAQLDDVADERHPVIALSIDDLRTISAEERDDPIGLWRFAKTLARVPLMGYGTAVTPADAYWFNRENSHILPSASQGERGVVLVPPTYGALRQVDQLDRADRHIVASPEGSVPVMVARSSEDVGTAIYAPLGDERRHCRIVELQVPIWVTNLGTGNDRLLFEAGLTHAIAVGMWRLRDIINRSVGSDVPKTTTLVVKVSCDDLTEEAIREAVDAPKAAWYRLSTDLIRRVVDVHVSAHAITQLADVSKQAEAELVAEVAMSLVAVDGHRAVAADVEECRNVAKSGERTIHARLGFVPGMHGSGILPRCRLETSTDWHANAALIGPIAQRAGIRPGIVPAERRTEFLNAVAAEFDAGLRQQLRCLEPNGMYRFLLGEQEKMHQEREAMRVRPVDPHTNRRDFSALKQRAFAINDHAAASRYLIEAAVLACPTGDRPLSLSTYDELLARAQHVVHAGGIAESYLSGLCEGDLVLLPSGHFQVADDDPFRETIESQLDHYTNALAAQDLLSNWAEFNADPNQSSVHDEPALESAFRAEFRLPQGVYVAIVQTLSDLASRDPLDVTTMRVADLTDLLATEPGCSRRQGVAALRHLSLRHSTDRARGGLFHPEVRPWRFRRAFSHLRRPIVVRGMPGAGLVATWGARSVPNSVEVLYQQLSWNRFDASSEELESYLGKPTSRRGPRFEKEVAELFRKNPKLNVRENRKHFGNLGLRGPDGNTLGDIDVLVIDHEQQVFLIVEAKDLSEARSSAEIRSELERLFGPKKSIVTKHLNRVAFVHENWPRIHAEESLHGSPDGWQIRDLIVTSRPLPSYDLMLQRQRSVPTKFVTIDDIRDNDLWFE